jgi:hypothetical protein
MTLSLLASRLAVEDQDPARAGVGQRERDERAADR